MAKGEESCNSSAISRVDKQGRQDFRERVFARDNHCCVVCGQPAVDAHHLLERRLWENGGYLVDNGVSLCKQHHLEAEATKISVEELRELAGITKPVLPDHLYRDQIYDKWGNIYLEDGRRSPGELFYDESVQKILHDAIVNQEFVNHFKYPRSYHLPWSPGATDDDRILSEIPWVGRDLVITEKLDGENTTLYRDYYHARSLDSGYHPSRNWVKNFHAKFAHEIPPGWRICGENMQAKHSIKYDDMPGFFFVFSIWDEQNRCLSWDQTVEWAELLEVPTVPLLADTRKLEDFDYNSPPPKELIKPSFSKEIEGYVIRVADDFDYKDFRNSLGKYVREGHVDETRHHWQRRQMVENGLRKS
jgi:hypothetical protein